MSETKLLPCPDRVLKAIEFVEKHGQWFNPHDRKLVREAAKLWATRTPSQPVQDKERAIAALKKLSDPDFDWSNDCGGQLPYDEWVSHVAQIALESASKVETPVVDVEDLIIEAHHDINKKNAGQSYVKAGDISQTIRHLAASGYLRTPPLPKPSDEAIADVENEIMYVKKLKDEIYEISGSAFVNGEKVTKDQADYMRGLIYKTACRVGLYLSSEEERLEKITTHPEAAAVVDLDAEIQAIYTEARDPTKNLFIRELADVDAVMKFLAAKYPSIFKSSAQRGG